MNPSFFRLIMSVILLSSAAVVPLQSRPSKTPNLFPMVAEFRDDFADRIWSDELGIYVHDLDSVWAVLDDRGDFDLKTNMGQGEEWRKLNLDFGDPASPDANPPFLTGLEAAFLSTGCGCLPDLGIGESVRSSLSGFFTYAGANWFIRFDPSEYPDTSNILITRTSENSWVIEAGPNDIVKLLRRPVKGKSVMTDHGNFFLPFQLVVTAR